MTPYKQIKTSQNGERGNCLATSLACILDTPVDNVPQFEEMERNEWKPALLKWLNSKGFSLQVHNNPPDGYAIAVGWCNDGVLHAVIVKDGEFYHDPNPSNEFVNKIRNYWALTKILQNDDANSLHTERPLWSDKNNAEEAISNGLDAESIIYNLLEDIQCLKENAPECLAGKI
ncbi:MAG: hypothetical protein QM500_19965 [Methylococcales bacterium]